MASTPTGHGYWLVASDGGVFALGDAWFVGSAGAEPTTSPAVGIVPDPTGGGYWLGLRDGTIQSFGTASTVHAFVPLTGTPAIAAAAHGGHGTELWATTPRGGLIAYV
jgi:hypothetical protein